ncbi:type II toxin-antitoxin system RelE/ParE family toxin [Pseudotabrizicola alkalilacus]|uniref:Addiction module toxin RelE n=1 Tax=Pseudotabrizicola alkalilacus TaxID=2305252 RepID=A0A411Z775_9RHOB|nr:type II toxin-antitoxin system RelE/ParE family toxin [Pseudotabrizicola alkalilacus]RGP38906.1 addiction module toxin RelE [Pseudotabrizicola alkalilacus]
MLTTVVELDEFLRQAKGVMTQAERAELVDTLAANPEAGVSLGGGLRKLRFGRAGGGKSGGFRTIHFYRRSTGPVILVAVFAKNEKANLSAPELATLLKLGDLLAAHYGRRI